MSSMARTTAAGSTPWSGSWTHSAFDRRSRATAGDVRSPTDQHITAHIGRGARRARRPDRAGRSLTERRRLRQRQPGLLPGALRRGARPARTAALGVGPDRNARVARPPSASVLCPGGQHRLVSEGAFAGGQRVRAACDIRFASREKSLLGQFEVGAGVVSGRTDGPAFPPRGPWPALEILLRRRRSRRAARGAVRVRQPSDRRRPPRRGGRGDGRTTRPLDHDRIPRTKSSRSGDAARQQRVPARPGDFFEMLGALTFRSGSPQLEAARA